MLRARKACSKCKKRLLFSAFSFKIKAKRIRQTICKKCHKKEAHEWYEKNRGRQADNVAAWKFKQLSVIRRYHDEYLREHPCVDCGETRVATLGFDHVWGRKKQNISYMIAKGVSLKTLKTEIVKCEVRCASCRSIRAKKRGERVHSSAVRAGNS